VPGTRGGGGIIFAAMDKTKALLETMRPRSWTKNLFVFAGILFGRVWEVRALGITALATLGFCLVSSSIYLLNDVADREADRRHPEKRIRPVASGRLSPAAAVSWALLLGLGTAVVAWVVAPAYAVVITAYLLLQAGYSAGLKHVVILDALIIAMGFVLRAMAGVEAGLEAGYDLSISPWLVICTFFLAVFLAFSKRRAEVLTLGDGAEDHRKNLAQYSPQLLDQMISIATASSLMGYSIYTVSDRTANEVSSMLWVTIPFVAYGIFRYQYLVHTHAMGGSPDRVLIQDKPLLVNVLLWIAAVATILAVFPAG